jgi:L-ribulokinase
LICTLDYKNTMNTFTIGVDFGTDSVRAIMVNTQNGHTLAEEVAEYPRWKKQQYCEPSISQFRQHPLDYLESIEKVLTSIQNQVNLGQWEQVKAISIDTTGSTPIAVDSNGEALSLKPEFAENPNAMFVLWKDHTANVEAEEINILAKKWDIDFTKYVGGIYSSEWFWAKIMHIQRVDDAVKKAAFSWVEHCDWISAQLTGETNPLTLKRSRCAAGHKAMWHKDFEGLPSQEFLTTLEPSLEGIRNRLFSESYTSDTAMGTLGTTWAQKLGLPQTVVIGVGAFDCHMGAVGAEIEPFDFVRVMGTSTCDMLIAPNQEYGNKLVPGICGQVDGSIVPNMLGLEAGQSAYGDYFAWFKKVILQPYSDLMGLEAAHEYSDKIFPYLESKAQEIAITENDLVATDWINGRRTPDANHTLKASFSGLQLGTSSAHIYKAIVEATAFGSKAIVDRFLEQGIPIKQVIAIGGVAQKSDFVMQTLSDTLNMPIKVAATNQACALGAAMNASVAAGIHATVKDAQKAMGSGFNKTFTPSVEKHEKLMKLYTKYLALGATKI